MSFPKKLYELRIQKGLSQKRVADLIGVSQTAICDSPEVALIHLMKCHLPKSLPHKMTNRGLNHLHIHLRRQLDVVFVQI